MEVLLVSDSMQSPQHFSLTEQALSVNGTWGLEPRSTYGKISRNTSNGRRPKSAIGKGYRLKVNPMDQAYGYFPGAFQNRCGHIEIDLLKRVAEGLAVPIKAVTKTR